MGKAIVIACFLAVFAVLIAVPTMMIPDHVEAMGFNYLARKTEDWKREAILNSPEVQMLEIEIEGLEAQVEAAKLACPVATEEDWKQRLASWWPFGA